MRSSLLLLSALSVSVSIAASPPVRNYKETEFRKEDVFNREVLIIGGGGTGAFAAARLKDKGKNIAVVELDTTLGGHVNTYKDPATGFPIDYGVQAYIQNEQTTAFFKRFDVPLNVSGLSPFPSKIADFKTGFVVPNATAPDPNTLVGPLTAYLFSLGQFDFLASGAYDIPKKVPEDLLLPFGQFAAKYNLTEVIQVIWIFAHGVGNLLETPTLYVLQNFGQPHILGLASGYLYSPAGNQVLYDKVGAFLGKDVQYSSEVIWAKRNKDGVRAVVKTGCNLKYIKAKKLLITIPPTLKNLAAFDLDETETSVFQQWEDNPYYVGVISNTGLPDQTNFINVDLAAPAALPQKPFVWRLETLGVPGLLTVKVIGERDSEKARALVVDAVRKLGGKGEVKFPAWKPHKNLQLHVSAEAVRGGFYSKLNALQGKRSTHYTGNAWASDYSPLLWAFTEEKILPAL